MKIIIVEDDLRLRNELKIFIEKHGFEVKTINDYKSSIERILQSDAHLVLLDINLPGIDGHHICKEVRKTSNIPIIMITSQNSDLDELMSMNFGADDFVAKPFNPQILLARMQSVLRRSYKESTGLSVGPYQLNLKNSTLNHKEVSIELTKNELKVLSMMMEKPNEIVSRNDLMEGMWQTNQFIDDNTLTVNINRLRKKLEQSDIHFLVTKRGQGYMICV